MFRDPGTFQHVLAGERILGGELPRADWLTFTRHGEPWIAHQWLAEAAMAALHRLAGLDALLLASTGTLAALFTWIFNRLASSGIQVRWAVLLTAVLLMTSAGHFHVRPALVSIAAFAWTSSRLVDVELGRARIRDLFSLVPIFVVWVNCHGAAAGGIATVGLTVCLWLLAWRFGLRSPIDSVRASLLALSLIALTCATAFVTPYGIATLRAWADIIRSPAIANLIIEHGSLLRTRSWHLLPLAIVLIAVLATSRRWMPTSIVAVVWLALMCQRVRHAPLFAALAAMVLAYTLPTSRLSTWLRSLGVNVANAPRPRARSPVGTMCLLVVCAVAAAGMVHIATNRKSPLLARLDDSWWPVALVPELSRTQEELGSRATIINDTLFGSFIAYHVPGFAIFSDDRCELFGDEFMIREARGDAEWYARWVDEHDVRVALVRRGSQLQKFIERAPGWTAIASASPAVLYRRSN